MQFNPRLFFVSIFLFFLSLTTATGQINTISFSDEQGKPLEGVFVVDQKGNHAEISDAEGKIYLDKFNSQATLDMAINYAKERYAFGRPIGSYQAIKHKLADMYIALTLAKSNWSRPLPSCDGRRKNFSGCNELDSAVFENRRCGRYIGKCWSHLFFFAKRVKSHTN